MTDRERFEAFISGPPFERRVSRFPENPRLTGWPGHYRDHAVQLAWEAYCFALESSHTPSDGL